MIDSFTCKTISIDQTEKKDPQYPLFFTGFPSPCFKIHIQSMLMSDRILSYSNNIADETNAVETDRR